MLLLSSCPCCCPCAYVLAAGTDQRFKRLRVDGVNIGVSVWDTAGQDRFQSLTPMYYRGAQGVVVSSCCVGCWWAGFYMPLLSLFLCRCCSHSVCAAVCAVCV